MSPPSAHDSSPSDPSDDGGRPCTPDTAQRNVHSDSPGIDPNATPAKASATATAHAFDQPNKKTLRPVYTGLERMEYNLKQVTLDCFLNDHLPGSNIPKKHLSNLHYVADASSVTREWKLNTAICRIAESVTSCKTQKGKKGRKSKKSNKEKGDEHSIIARDIANWTTTDTKHSSDADDAPPTPDDGEDASDPADDPKTSTRVDVGVFFKNDRFEDVVSISPQEFMKKSRMKSKADKEERKNYVGRCSWADILVPIEVKINTQKSAFYFEDDPTKFLRTDSNDGREALGQLGEYVGQIFGHQHRVHLYAVYVYKDRARLLYFERQGALVSEPFQYGTRKHLTLHTFFWRIAHMSREELGLDPTVLPADPEDVKDMLAYAPIAPTDYIEKQIYHALSVDPKRPEDPPTSSQWPAYQMTMCGKRYIIARPMFASPALYGRCTRGYLAYDIEGKAVRFMKDSWRLDLERVQPEHKVYERLQNRGVAFVATCLAHEDVPSNGAWQRTTVHSLLSPPRPARGHYRLLIKEVCRPLTDFADFAELTALMCFAIIAHRQAWEKAGILHRDISVSNILIVEEGRGKVVRTAILSDWDLCKYKEEMSKDMKARTPDRTGTWYFRSALSLLFPRRPYRLADDIESFVHVYHYCVLRFHETNKTKTLCNYVESVYDFVEVREADGAHVGSETKLEHMCSPTPQIIPTKNQTLKAFLTDIAKLCSEHYASIDLDQLAEDDDPSKPKRPQENPNAVPAQAALLSEFAPPPTGKRQRSPERPSTPTPTAKKSTVTSNDQGRRAAEPKLNEHKDLQALFIRYATGHPDEKGYSVRWPAETTKCEDLFKGTSVAARKNNHFSSSRQSYDPRQDLGDNGRPAKKRKANNGSAQPLPDVEESVEEGAED
ncbi:hypothetical protein C8T65DRAFT_741826 [Cerioporus squamosus]|nr:hypothetical protein C8T65DRAFT_741826 [Cerioporus squamosus]